MASLFPPWTDHVVRPLLVAIVVIGVGLPVLLMAWARTPYRTDQDNPLAQPILFDHRHHVRDDGIDCLYCHTTAERAATAGIPPTELCMNCHNQIWNDSPVLASVWRSFVERQPIRWVRVTRLPDFVFFNHAIHTTRGIGCETCHGRVDQMARVYQAEPMTMRWCLECHRNPEPHLRPLIEVTTMGLEEGGGVVAAVSSPRTVEPVRHLTNCSTCHR